MTTFTTDQVEKILSNIGIDTTCGTCMEIAFTGNRNPEMAHTCKESPFAESLDNIRCALEQSKTHHLIMADDVATIVDALKHIAYDETLSRLEVQNIAKEAITKARIGQ